MTKPPARVALVSVALALATMAGSQADASVSIAVSYDALVHDSTAVTVATATEARAVWEDGRIVTYTHLHVDRSIAGALPTNSEPWVASLGGIVGTIGQVVDGEPTLRVGMPYLLFLRPDSTATQGVFIVTARAQGQFHLKAATSGATPAASGAVQVKRNPGVGEILPPRGVTTTKAAADAIADRNLDDVAKDIATAWAKSHAK